MTQRLLVGLIVFALVAAGSVGGERISGGQHARTTEGVAGPTGDVTGDTDAFTGTADAIAGPRILEDLGEAEDRRVRQGIDCDYERLFDRANNATVTVRVSNRTGDFALGSGWIYEIANETAYVVTNWHVVFNGTGYDVQFATEQWRDAELVGSDSWSDLAVLRVENVPESARALGLANRTAERGQAVAVLGNPLGLDESISRGIVSGVDRAVSVQYQDGINRTVPDTIQTDAPVEGGNSGGPLVNCAGEVVGVNYASAAVTDVSFAISSRTVREVVPSIVENGTYSHSLLGVVPVTVTPTLAEVNDLNVTRGVLVAGVLPRGPADDELRPSPAIHRRTGLPYGGDVILAMEGTKIRDEEDLLSYLLFETRPGETVNVTVLRDGQNRTVQVTLGQRPVIPARPRPRTTPAPTTTATLTTETATTTMGTETSTTNETVTTTTETTTTTEVQPAANATDAA